MKQDINLEKMAMIMIMMIDQKKKPKKKPSGLSKDEGKNFEVTLILNFENKCFAARID